MNDTIVSTVSICWEDGRGTNTFPNTSYSGHSQKSVF